MVGSNYISKRNLLVTLTAALVGLVYGYDIGSISSALLFLTPDFHLTNLEASIVTAAVVLGQLFGALAAGRIANNIGRKRTMVGVVLGYALFTGLQGVAPDKWSLAAIRFLLGLAIGISIVVAPAFIAESAPRRIRGSLLVSFQIATTTGTAVASFVGLALASSENWRLILSLAVIPAVLALVMIIRLTDTPRWLLMKGRRQEAVELLQQVDPEVDAEQEANVIERDLSYEERGSFTELFRGPFRKAGLFVVGLGFFVQITGINALVYFSPTIFQKGLGITSSSESILLAALVQVFGIVMELAAFFTVDRFGRRAVLLTGVSFIALANLVLVLAFALGPSIFLALIGIGLFRIGFSYGYGSLVWVYASESFPARLRTQGASAMLTADLFANFLVGILFLNIMGSLGGAVAFAIFLILSLISIAFIYRLAPETKGRQLEAIRAYWYNGGRWPEEVDLTETRQAESSSP